jgi:hypothetical protein
MQQCRINKNIYSYLLIGFLLIDFLLIDFLLIDFLLIDFLLIDFLLIDFLLIDFLLIGFLLIDLRQEISNVSRGSTHLLSFIWTQMKKPDRESIHFLLVDSLFSGIFSGI